MKKLFLVCILVAGGGAGFMAYLHSPLGQDSTLGRKILSWMGYSCPSEQISADQLDRLRSQFLAKLQGEVPAPNKRVWGLTLDKTNEFQLIQWIKRHQWVCEKKIRGYHFIKCRDVTIQPIKEKAEVDFAFNDNNRLIFVGRLYRQLSEEAATAITEQISKGWQSRLGPPTKSPLTLSAEGFTSVDSSTRSYEYRFQDYFAKLTASKLADGRFAIYEQHILIP